MGVKNVYVRASRNILSAIRWERVDFNFWKGLLAHFSETVLVSKVGGFLLFHFSNSGTPPINRVHEQNHKMSADGVQFREEVRSLAAEHCCSYVLLYLNTFCFRHSFRG